MQVTLQTGFTVPCYKCNWQSYFSLCVEIFKHDSLCVIFLRHGVVLS